MESLRSGNEERAWNDPPVFSYTSTSSQAPKRQLTSRVSHTLQSLAPSQPESKESESEFSGQDLSLSRGTPSAPPIFTDLHVPTFIDNTCLDEIAPTVSAASPNHSNLDVPDEIMHTESMDIFNRFLTLSEHHMQPRVRDDVRKRLSILTTWWTDHKLSKEVKIKIYQLAKTMNNEDWESAYKLHIALMVDYISEVSQWLVGIKHIILESREKSNKKMLPKDHVINSDQSNF